MRPQTASSRLSRNGNTIVGDMATLPAEGIIRHEREREKEVTYHITIMMGIRLLY